MPETTPKKRIDVEVIDGIAVVSFADRKLQDEKIIGLVMQQLYTLLDVEGRTHILLNCSNLETVSSSAFPALITLSRRVQQAGGKLMLCSIAPKIHECMKLSRCESAFILKSDEQTALQAFRQ